MSVSETPEHPPETESGMGVFERFLSLFVAGAIVAGLGLGAVLPEAFAFLSGVQVASVNLVVAVLIWVMIYPMMVNIDLASLARIGERPKGLLITLIVNWAIKPFTMAALGIVFFRYVFSPFLAPEDAEQYIAGLIILGAAPCTAMVFVWSRLTRGDAEYTLIQVTVNDLIMIVAFAPIVGLLLGVTDLVVPWHTLLISAGLFVALPLAAGLATRHLLLGSGAGERGEMRLNAFSQAIKPASAAGLLLTVVLLFGLQGGVILDQPLVIGMIAVPLIIQAYGVFLIAYAAAWFVRTPHEIAAPCALIGTSNFFELAVAVAIGLFGLSSGAALATVVGVLVEVPVMLSLVAISNRTRTAFSAR
ncbi:ACR3 family arsenite efflux transporter [Hyphobacterium sp.]|uniref:ACR3 family arsenite efflux transporter n=1 Tax=Hyphobacterium sp. TaxID=2004662 RepID=UPI003B51869E